MPPAFLTKRLLLKGAFPLLLGLFAFTCTGAASEGPEYAGKRPTLLVEASGLACSPVNQDLLWLNNDSGDTAKLYAISSSGTYKGSLSVKGVEAIDWEDCTSFTQDGVPFLLVADTGDNLSQRAEVRLIILREPDAASLSPDRCVEVAPAWQIRFCYPDGPRDCEAAAVDVAAQRVLLVSKRTLPPVLYSVPLQPADKQPILATRLTPLSWLKPPSPSERLIPSPKHRYARQPTGLSISADNHHAALLTYTGVWLFSRADGQTWEERFSEPDTCLPVQDLDQAEAVGLSPDGGLLYVTGEKKNQPLLRWTLAHKKP